MTTTTTAGSTGHLDDSGSGTGGATGSSSGSTGSTGSSGSAGEASGACPDIYAAVCGKDGETYDNACVAEGAGVEIRHDGPCLGDCEGSCVVAPQAPSLLGLVLLVLAFVRPRRKRR